MNDNNRSVWAAWVRGLADIVIHMLWISALVTYLMPLLWEVHKAINVHGAR
jgi:hypothetical protein